MSSFNKFQSDNAKYTRKESRTNYNADFNPTVASAGLKEKSMFNDNLDKYVEFISWARFYPDLFLDLIRPKTGGIKLHSDQRTFMRIVIRFLSMYGVYPRGWGKCISGDSLIFSDEGIKEIGEYFNYYQGESEEWINSDSISILNRYGEKESVSSLYYGGYKPTKKIITEYNYNIEGTLNHPILKMDEDGNIVWCNLEDLKVGDYIAINRKNNLWGNNVDIDKELEMKDWLKTLSKQSTSHLYIREMPKVLDQELSLLLGYLVGDGCLTVDGSIIFSNMDDDILTNYKNIINNKFNREVKKRFGENVDYITTDKYLKKYLEFLGIDNSKAHHKKIPNCIMKSTKSNVASFLRGLFDTDGTIEIKKSLINVCTVSEELANQVQICLLNFGIISRIKKRYNKKGQFHYLVMITSDNVKIFYDEIGFGCERKQNKLLQIINKKLNPNKDIIPFQDNIITEYYNDIKYNNKNIDRIFYNLLKNNNRLTYKKLKILLELNNANISKHYNHLKNLYDEHYFFIKINEIQDSQNYVYDFSLLESHSFISNGIISHNTFNEEIIMFVICVLFPGIELSLTAQTKENAAELLKDKYNDILKKYPWFKNEIYEVRLSKNDAEIKFVNDSRID